VSSSRKPDNDNEQADSKNQLKFLSITVKVLWIKQISYFCKINNLSTEVISGLFKNKVCLFCILVILVCLQNKQGVGQTAETKISVEKSPYGMLFTQIELNGHEVKAIIDFGDPSRFQISDSLVSLLNIPVRSTNKMAMDILGNQYPVNDGIIDSIKIGEMIVKNDSFSSSPKEMKIISQQINTHFDAVVGWGFFSDYYVKMDYHNNTIGIGFSDSSYGTISRSQSYNNDSI